MWCPVNSAWQSSSLYSSFNASPAWSTNGTTWKNEVFSILFSPWTEESKRQHQFCEFNQWHWEKKQSQPKCTSKAAVDVGVAFSRAASASSILRMTSAQWDFQDPKIEVLYHIRAYFVIPLHRPYIGLIYGRCLYMVGALILGSWNSYWSAARLQPQTQLCKCVVEQRVDTQMGRQSVETYP